MAFAFAASEAYATGTGTVADHFEGVGQTDAQLATRRSSAAMTVTM